MVLLVLVVGLLVTGPACGGTAGAEIEALMVEIREMHAATVEAHECLAAGAAHVARAEARAARGEPLFLDVDTLTRHAATAAAQWDARIDAVKTSHASVLTQIEDAMARGVWDLHFPFEAGAGLTPRGIVASVRDAARAERDRAREVIEFRDAGTAAVEATDEPQP